MTRKSKYKPRNLTVKNFRNKESKRNLEKQNAQYVSRTLKGSICMLTGPDFASHWETWSFMLGKNSLFVVPEREPDVALEIREQIMNPNSGYPYEKRIILYQRNFWDALSLPTCGKRKYDQFRYIDFDACRTLPTLILEEELYENLHKLAQCKNLKNLFYFSITVCIRNGKKIDRPFLEEQVPSIFKGYGWKLTTAPIIKPYGGGMENAFYTFYKNT